MKLRRRRKDATFIPGERARFLCGSVPALVLALEAEADMFPPTSDRPTWPPTPLEGWRLLPRLTLTAVDAFERGGFLVQGARVKEEAEHFFRWLEDVAAAHGAVLLATAAASLPQEPALDAQSLYGSPGMRGGFIASMDAE